MAAFLHRAMLCGAVFLANAWAEESPLSKRFGQPEYEELGEDQKLAPLFGADTAPTLADWQRERAELRKRWDAVLGKPSFGEYDKRSKVIDGFDGPGFRGTILQQPTGPGARQLVLLMEPVGAVRSPRPGAIVPFYHPDAMAGFDLKKREPIKESQTIQFGRHLVQQGYVVVCTEAFPYNTVPEPEKGGGMGWWQAAAAKLLRDHPDWTGMGKLVHDTRRGVDLLLEQPDIDPARIVVIGHSLGGKMAFYAGCLDPRIKATVATDFGIGWDFTNWSDPWYLGDQIQADEFALAHHHLLALHAPRPFLLVAGQYDKPESWQYLNAVKPTYALYGDSGTDAVGMIDHASGHRPTADSMRLAYRWLAEQFGLEPQAWKF